MAKVFISYSRKDIEFAKRLTGKLLESNWDYWIDWEGIPPTVEWWNEIQKGIEEADTFLFLISPDSITSKVCGQEIDTAVRNGKRIIPVVVREIRWEDTPSILSRFNYIFYTRGDSFESATEKLLIAIHTDYEWAATHRRLQVKALEWERNHKENSFLLRGKDLGDAELQLAKNSSKEPYPTDLQREYVFESRQETDRQQLAEDKRRRNITRISIAGVITLTILAVFGFYQARQATKNATDSQNNAATAQANLVIAQTAQADAQNKQILADNNAATAIANEQESKRQANIALARTLIVEAKSLNSSSPNSQARTIKGLLSILSMKLSPSSEASGEMQNITFTQPIREWVFPISVPFESISSLAVSSDGKYVAAITSSSAFRIWKVNSGDEIKLDFTDNIIVTSVTFSPNSQYIAIGYIKELDSGVQILEISTGNRIRNIPLLSQAGPLLFSSDSKYIAAGGYVRQAYIGFCVWDVTTGITISCMPQGENIYNFALPGANPFAISPDGKLAASATRDNKIARIWDVITGQAVAEIKFSEFGESVIFSPDGKYAIISGCDTQSPSNPDGCNRGSIKIFDIATLSETLQISHDGSVSPLAISPNGRLIASGSTDGIATIWDLNTGTEVSRLEGTTYTVSIAFSPDSNYLVTGGGSGTQIWETTTGDLISEYSGLSYNTAFGPDSKTVIAGDSQNKVFVLKIDNPREIAHIIQYGGSGDIAFSPDGKLIAFGGYYDYTVYVRDIENGREVMKRMLDDSIFDVIFSPDNKYLAAESNDEVIIWDVASGSEISRINTDSEKAPLMFNSNVQIVLGRRTWDILTGKEILELQSPISGDIKAYSSDGKYALVIDCEGLDDHDNCREGNAIVTDYETGKEISRMTYTGIVFSAAFSPDNHLVVSSGCEIANESRNCIQSTIRVWESRSGIEVSRVTYAGFPGGSVFFSPNGKYVASTGGDFSGLRGDIVDIWEAATGKIVYHIDGNYGLHVAGFNSNGKFVMTVECLRSDESDYHCLQESVRVLRWQPEDLIENACRRLPRNLTRLEWQQYIGDVLPYQKVCENLPIESEVLIMPTAIP